MEELIKLNGMLRIIGESKVHALVERMAVCPDMLSLDRCLFGIVVDLLLVCLELTSSFSVIEMNKKWGQDLTPFQKSDPVRWRPFLLRLS